MTKNWCVIVTLQLSLRQDLYYIILYSGQRLFKNLHFKLRSNSGKKKDPPKKELYQFSTGVLNSIIHLSRCLPLKWSQMTQRRLLANTQLKKAKLVCFLKKKTSKSDGLLVAHWAAGYWEFLHDKHNHSFLAINLRF